MYNLVSVVILNWLRPNNIKNKILPELVECPDIGEIIISHGKESTYFNCFSKKKKIYNRKDWELNSIFGLSLRFIAGQQAEYNTILFIDDDLIVHPSTISNMFSIYNKNKPCLVGRFGRNVGNNLTYDSRDVSINTINTPILLTSLLMFDKSICDKFFNYSNLISKYVLENSKPLWNGEDIFISLLGIKLYQKWGILLSNPKYFPVQRLRTESDLSVAISQDSNHCKYRSNLIKLVVKLYNLSSYNLYHSNNMIKHILK